MSPSAGYPSGAEEKQAIWMRHSGRMLYLNSFFFLIIGNFLLMFKNGDFAVSASPGGRAALAGLGVAMVVCSGRAWAVVPVLSITHTGPGHIS